MEIKFFKPLKVKKTCIDLRGIAAQEQHEEAIARTKALDLATMMSDERGDLVQLSGAPEVETPPLPTFYPDTRASFSFLGIIKSELFNLIKI